MIRTPCVYSESGVELPVKRPPCEGETLSDWLAEQGIPLNTRCGKRELCGGCRVEIGPARERARSCQVYAGDVEEVWIPRNSRFDRSLTGVSLFDLSPSVIPEDIRAGSGVALDIGTTTLAAALWKGAPPSCLATASRSNPQIPQGDNVVSRIQFSLDHPGGYRLLHETLWKEGILPLIQSVCDQAGVRPDELEDVVFTGNPAMLHTVAGVPLQGLALYPFSPEFLEQRDLKGSEVGLPDQIHVRLLAGLGPFVGSDVSAGAVASGMLVEEGPGLLIDFGTNGEILLKTDSDYLATATAAGPAFEGGRLTSGSAAGPGVISRFSPTGKTDLDAHGPGAPYHGISGAAYVDYMAIGVAQGWLGASGRYVEGSAPDFAEGLQVTEPDIAELIQAKAAIQGGWMTLLEEAGLHIEDLRWVRVAGGFGYHLNPTHAMRIGMLPTLPLDRFQIIGNASLGGASLGLLSPETMTQLGHLHAESTYIELNRTDSFEDHYIDAMLLEPADM